MGEIRILAASILGSLATLGGTIPLPAPQPRPRRVKQVLTCDERAFRKRVAKRRAKKGYR
jgi:hypothetical protein